MARASFMQTSFLGGEWSGLAQGRMDSEGYKQGLNLCQNYYPVEEGALMRRQGTRYITHTRRGLPASLRGFDFSITAPYQIEFSALKARFFRGTAQIPTATPLTIIDISSATPAVVETIEELPSHWATGDDIWMTFEERDDDSCPAPKLCNRQFTITKLTANTFSIADALTQASIDGTSIYTPAFGKTDYVSGEHNNIRLVQNEDSAILLHGDYAPRRIGDDIAATDFTFGIEVPDLLDGPYLDENDTAYTITPGATSGSTTLGVSSISAINNGQGFLTTDVGRLVRLRSSPAAWSGAATYSVGDTVTGTDDNVYTSLKDSNTNHDPTSDLVNWSLSAATHIWNWAKITSWTSATSVNITFYGDKALLNTTATTHWRMGLFSDTTGWPTCGAYHEGRLWLSGVYANRIDGSKANDPFNFSPTSVDGTVADNNAVSATANANSVNLVLWMLTDADGLLFGTQAGEWRVRASGNDDPITPFSIQLRNVSNYGSANQVAVRASKATVFVQRQRRKLMEFKSGLSASYSAEWTANNLNLPAEHITQTGVEEIAYMQEPTPTIWSRLTDGTLVGCSYMRTSEKFYAGWHKHPLGGDRVVKSISTGPSFDGLTERLYMITNASTDLTTDVHWVEMLSDMFDGNRDDWEVWFVDSAQIPCCATISAGVLTLSGFHHLVGETVSGAVGGIDIGDHVVDANGQITITLGTDGDGLTAAFLATLADDYGSFGIPINNGTTVTAAAAPTHTVAARAWYDASVHTAQPEGTSALIDATNGIIYFAEDSGAKGIRKFTYQGTGDMVADYDITDLGITNLVLSSGGSFCMDEAGDFIYVCSDFANSSEYAKISTATMTSVGTMGAASATTTGVGPFAPYHMIAPSLVDSYGTTINYVMLSTTLNSHDISLFYTGGNAEFDGTCVWNYEFALANSRPIFAKAPVREHSATVFVLNKPSYGAAASTSWDLRRILIGEEAHTLDHSTQTRIAFDTIASLAPTDFDATWTNFSGCGGMLVDPVDGYPVIFAVTSDAVANKTAVIKVNPYTGAVVWRTPLTLTSWATGAEFNVCRANITTDDRAFYYYSAEVIYKLDLSDGTWASFNDYSTPAISVLTGGQISDASGDGLLVFYGQWNRNSWAGENLGTYAAATSSWGNTWMALYLGVQHYTTSYTVYETPGQIGYNYTSRAQLLRPDYGNDAGAANGPAFGKVRRIDQFAASIYRTRSISFGTEFGTTKQRPFQHRTEGGTAVVAPTLKSGIIEASIEGSYTTEAQICWEQKRPYPGVITAVGGFISTQDK